MEATEKRRVISALISSRRATLGNRVIHRPEVLVTGTPALDSFLPHGGFERAGITELVGSGSRHSLAALALAAASRCGHTAYIGCAGIINPSLLTSLGGVLERTHFLVDPVPKRLLWSAQQILASGLFQLVVFHASAPASGLPLLTPASYRRFLGHTRDTRAVFIILLDSHPALQNLGRPCALRLEVNRAPKDRGECGDKTEGNPQGELLHLRIAKSASGSPGKEIFMRCPC